MNASRKRTEIDRALTDGMTVAQLIEALHEMPEDAVVLFGIDYGDICHTEQALVVCKVEELDDATEYLEASAYSRSGIAIERRDKDDECDEEESSATEESNRIVILRS